MKAMFYVAPNGNDAWSGTRSEPTANGADGPFATLQRARDALRGAAGRAPRNVLVRGGSYALAAPLEFLPEDSGSSENPVTYAAFPGEAPVFSGGRRIEGLRVSGKHWVGTIPEVKNGEWVFQQLFVNGQRRRKARAPNTGFYRIAGSLPAIPAADGKGTTPNKTGFRFNRGEIDRWSRLADATITLIHSWETSIHPIKAVDTHACTVTFSAPLKEWWKIGHWEGQGRWYIEGVRELLDEPGEWYLNRDTGEFVYYPMPGETLGDTELVAPVLTSFVHFRGDPEAGLPVEHVHIRGLRFHHADWTLKPEGNSDTQAAVSVPGVVSADGARNCSVSGCEIAHIGNYGIWFRRGCKDCDISGNHLFDLGGGGIRIGDSRMAATDDGETSRTLVAENYIHDFGEVFAAGVGIWIAQSSHNRVAHNEIHDGYYTAISVGWNWSKAPNRTHHNLIEYNSAHHIVRGMLSDGAGIYTLGTQTGTVIRNNIFHDIWPYEGNPNMAWGIYFDQGSNGITAENNIAYNTLTGGLMNTGQADNTVRNNIFAYSARHAVWRWKYDGPPPSTVERNIFYVTQGELFHRDGGIEDHESKWDHNLYWRTDGRLLTFYGHTLEEWQEEGVDRNSRVADPMFVDPAARNFDLRPESPALEMGFKPIDTGTTGLTDACPWIGLRKVIPPSDLPPLPPEPGPELIHEDFEDIPAGHTPGKASVFVEGKGDSLAVTGECAASGTRSLKFQDAPGLEHVWNPHMFYAPHFRDGKAVLEFDVRLESGAVLNHEWRDSQSPFNVGPSLLIEGGGRLLANGKPLGPVPANQWVHVRIICGMGVAANGSYDLTVRMPGVGTIAKQGLPCGSGRFRALEWLGFISVANTSTAFHVDNILLEPEKN